MDEVARGAKPVEANGPWDLPDGWAWVPLRELGTWTSGSTPKSTEPRYYGGPIPWFRITELSERRLYTAAKTLTELGLRDSSAKMISAPFLMFAMYGASIGKMAISEIDAATNQAIACCSPYRGVDIDYLFWALQFSKKAIVALGQGGAQPNISQRILLEQKIPLAPLAEQRRIVQRIDALFAEIADGEAALQAARKGLDTFRRALLKAAVTGELTKDWREQNKPTETGHDLLARIRAERAAKVPLKGRRHRNADSLPLDAASFPELPTGWGWTTVKQVADVFGGLTKNPDRENLPEQAPYLRVANVQMGALDLGEMKLIGVTPEDRKRAALAFGDVLVVEGNGSIDQIGRCALWRDELKGCVHQNHIIKVRLKMEWLSEWMLTWLLSPAGRGAIERVVSSTSGLHTLSISKIESLPVPVPPRLEAAEILRRVSDALVSAADTLAGLDAEASDAARLRQSVLKAAFEGRLVPQDPTDEPAASLLARLAAEPSVTPVRHGGRAGKVRSTQ